MDKNVCSSETKWTVAKNKMSGQLTPREIIGKHGINNKSPIETRARWFRNNEIYRFDQPIGEQYFF